MGSLEVVGNKKVIWDASASGPVSLTGDEHATARLFACQKVTRAKCLIPKINPLFSQAVRDLLVGGACQPRGRRTATSGYRWGALRPHRSPRVVGATVALWQV